MIQLVLSLTVQKTICIRICISGWLAGVSNDDLNDITDEHNTQDDRRVFFVL